MKNVLVIQGHTDLQHDSFNNKIIMADLEKALPEARFEYLDAMYPNFKIDVKKGTGTIGMGRCYCPSVPHFLVQYAVTFGTLDGTDL